jgi:hypothetical protein
MRKEVFERPSKDNRYYEMRNAFFDDLNPATHVVVFGEVWRGTLRNVEDR